MRRAAVHSPLSMIRAAACLVISRIGGGRGEGSRPPGSTARGSKRKRLVARP